MAVEAHHLHLFPSQLLINREFMNAIENQSTIYNPQMGFVAAGSGSFTPFAAAASDSGLTFNNLPRKRQRGGDHSLCFLGEDVSSQFQQQMIDIDRLVVQHAEKVRMELMERRKRFSIRIVAAIEEGVSKKLKAKEKDMERISKLNWALEERIKSLNVENQIWRYLAETNEAAANVLRNNLEQVLAEQVKVKEEQKSDAAAAAEDAESCCCGDNNNNEAEEKQDRAAVVMRDWNRMCRACGEEEPSVLLLPCRHLCLCAACGPAINDCPICKCSKTGSVNVNLS